MKLHGNNDNGITLVEFATSENLIIQSRIFQHLNVHKYT